MSRQKLVQHNRWFHVSVDEEEYCMEAGALAMCGSCFNIGLRLMSDHKARSKRVNDSLKSTHM